MHIWRTDDQISMEEHKKGSKYPGYSSVTMGCGSLKTNSEVGVLRRVSDNGLHQSRVPRPMIIPKYPIECW